MGKKLFAILSATLLLTCCLIVAVSAADDTALIGTTGYSTLQAAVTAYQDTAEPIILQADTAENITIAKDTYLDLNGHNITGTVTVTAGTLYCMDSQTDDYTILDTAGYGTVNNVSGNIAGVPAEAACAEDGYLMIRQDNAYSFHRVNLQIYAMSLRSENTGLYYKSHFAGDELVAQNVQSFGVALSVYEIPTAQNLEGLCRRSVFNNFTAGENNTDATSTLLKGVMKTTNALTTNSRNSQMPVYGRAYIETADGDFFFGEARSRSFKEQVQLAANDQYWKDLKVVQKDAAVSMYRLYKDIMQLWDVRNIESRMCLNTEDPLPPANKESLKVLAITSSFGLNTTQLLYDIAVAEGYAPENVTVARLYTSGCTLKKHIQYAPNKPVYQYTKISGDPNIVSEYNGTVGKMTTLKTEGNATLLDGLLDEEWDVIFMQQGARESSLITSYVDANGNDYITQLRDIMKPYVDQQCPDARFIWNMLWAYDQGSPEYPYSTTFNSDQMAMYQGNVDSTMKYVVPRTDYDRIIPSGTAIQNARTSFFGETLSRDTYHLNNLGGTIAGYTLYAVITGQKITEINLNIVTASNTNGIGGAAKINTPFTEEDKLVIMESVNNALKNPFSPTQSQYPPIDYSDYTYAEDLEFFSDSQIAVCPACQKKVAWTEINQNNVGTFSYLGTSSTMESGTYHLYLSSDVTFTGSNYFLNMGAGGRNVCLHLNGNDLTASKNAIAVIAGNAKLNVMGTGTVSGNHQHSQTFRGSSFVLNSGTKSSDPGVLRLYSGTYVQPASNTQLAPVSTSFQGGKLEIYEDVTITGNAGSYSVALHTGNNPADESKTHDEIVNIYGGTFNRPVCASLFSNTSINDTLLNIYGGTFNDGIEIDTYTTLTVSGTPVIKGNGLKLPAGVIMNLGELKPGAEIAVDATGAFTAENSNATAYAGYFSSAVTGNKITVSNNILYCQTSSIYTKNLEFAAGSNTAYCPACGADKEWTEVNQTNLSSHTILGTSSTMAKGTYHLFLSSDVTYEGGNFLLNMGAGGRNLCLHLNGNNLTATDNGIGVLAGNAKLNIMGTGTVSGNHTNSSLFRGSAFVLNAGTTTDPGILRLYSGTYVQPESNTQFAPISTSWQAGLMEIYEDVTVYGNTQSIHLTTRNGNASYSYTETVNIYGGTFHKAIHCESDSASTTPATSLNISGGTFIGGITVVDNTNITLSGAPVIMGAGLVLPSGTTVTLNQLTQGASIAVNANGAFSVANTLAADYLKYFSAVQNGYSITETDGVLSCKASA